MLVSVPIGSEKPFHQGVPLDFNLVVVAGKLAVSPEVDESGPHAWRRQFAADDGSPGGGRLLLTVRSTNPSRIDLLPVSARADQIPAGVAVGDQVAVAGQLQRRFSGGTGRSRIEIVAHHIESKASEA